MDELVEFVGGPRDGERTRVTAGTNRIELPIPPSPAELMEPESPYPPEMRMLVYESTGYVLGAARVRLFRLRKGEIRG